MDETRVSRGLENLSQANLQTNQLEESQSTDKNSHSSPTTPRGEHLLKIDEPSDVAAAKRSLSNLEARISTLMPTGDRTHISTKVAKSNVKSSQKTKTKTSCKGHFDPSLASLATALEASASSRATRTAGCPSSHSRTLSTPPTKLDSPTRSRRSASIRSQPSVSPPTAKKTTRFSQSIPSLPPCEGLSPSSPSDATTPPFPSPVTDKTKTSDSESLKSAPSCLSQDNTSSTKSGFTSPQTSSLSSSPMTNPLRGTLIERRKHSRVSSSFDSSLVMSPQLEAKPRTVQESDDRKAKRTSSDVWEHLKKHSFFEWLTTKKKKAKNKHRSKAGDEDSDDSHSSSSESLVAGLEIIERDFDATNVLEDVNTLLSKDNSETVLSSTAPPTPSSPSEELGNESIQSLTSSPFVLSNNKSVEETPKNNTNIQREPEVPHKSPRRDHTNEESGHDDNVEDSNDNDNDNEDDEEGDDAGNNFEHIENKITRRLSVVSMEDNYFVSVQHGKASVRAGTVQNLIYAMTLPDVPDISYMQDFMITFPYFISPQEFLEVLKKRFEYSSPPNAVQSLVQEYDNNRPIIQMRVYSVLKLWLESYTYYFRLDHGLLSRLEEFIENTLSKVKPLWATHLQHIIKQKVSVGLSPTLKPSGERSTSKKAHKTKPKKSIRIEGSPNESSSGLVKSKSESNGQVSCKTGDIQTASKSEPPRKHHSTKVSTLQHSSISAIILKTETTVAFLNLDPKEIARQLSLIEHEIFCSVAPTELQFARWKNRNRKKLAPNVVSLINWFNKVTNWVATEIVTTFQLKRRIRVVSRFIQICKMCYDLMNFNAAMEILSSLNMTCIDRLKDTWKGLPKKDKETLDYLRHVFQAKKNYQNYRNVLESIQSTCLPYIGIVLQDLLMLEAIPTFEKEGVVNFQKMHKISHILHQVYYIQRTRYTFDVVPAIRDYLKTVRVLDEVNLYKYSKLCEEHSSVYS